MAAPWPTPHLAAVTGRTVAAAAQNASAFVSASSVSSWANGTANGVPLGWASPASVLDAARRLLERTAVEGGSAAGAVSSSAAPASLVGRAAPGLSPWGVPVWASVLLAVGGLIGVSRLWSLMLFPASLLGWRVYKVDDERHLQILKQRFVRAATIVHNNESTGWIFGCWFVGFINQSEHSLSRSQTCFLLARQAMMRQVTQPVFVETTTGRRDVFITVYDRCGGYESVYFTERKLNVSDFHPRPPQEEAIAHIQRHFAARKFATVLLSGAPNTGKSVVALLLAKQLNGSFVHEFNPTEPGNHFNNLYNKAGPSRERPLIVTFEEVDGMIDAVHHGKIRRHDSKPIAIHNKATWNTFLDNIDHGFYPFVVFLFTTNQPFAWFDELDASYMRRGRISVKLRLTESSCEVWNEDAGGP